MRNRGVLGLWAIATVASFAGVMCGGKAIVDPGSSTASGGSASTTATTGTTSTTGTTTPTTPTTPTTTTATSTVTCDVGDCGSCINSECASNVCAAEIEACTNNMQCIDINECLANCSSPDTCSDECKKTYPGGVAPITALYNCVICVACPVDCDAVVVCPYEI